MNRILFKLKKRVCIKLKERVTRQLVLVSVSSMTKHFNLTHSKSNKTYFFSYSSPKETHSDAKGPPSLCFLLKNPFTSLIFTRSIQFDFQWNFQNGDLVEYFEPSVSWPAGMLGEINFWSGTRLAFIFPPNLAKTFS